MSILSTAFDVGTRVIQKINEVKTTKRTCRKLGDIVEKLMPILAKLDEHLHKSEHRPIMETLLKALTDAEDVVDYIKAHPKYVAFYSGTYKDKLEEAMKNIDNWIIRIQPLTSGETFTQLGEIKTDVVDFSNELGQKLDDISDKLEDIPSEIVRQMRDELSSLVHQPGKSPQFQKFVDDEERRQLLLLETQIAKMDEAPNSFFCSISGDLMDDPCFCVVSGYTYEKTAIRKHIADCYMEGKDPYDPITRQVLERPNEQIVPNRALKDAIQEWKQNSRKSGHSSEKAIEEKRIKAEKALEEEMKKRELLEARLKAYETQQTQEASVLTFVDKPKVNSSSIKLTRSDEDIHKAVNLWYSNQAEAETKYGHISEWNVSSVTNMKELFKGKETFNDDISNWDVSNVTDMRSMFSYAQAFNQPIGSWDVSKVTNMGFMFSKAKAFNQAIGSWDVSKVTNMRCMFYFTTAFNQPIGNWDVSKVTTKDVMFWDCPISYSNKAFRKRSDEDIHKAVNLWYSNQAEAETKYGHINEWDVSSVTNMMELFKHKYTFNDDISNWDVSNVTDMYDMFNNAHAFNQPIGNWDVSNVTNLKDMFSYAKAFNQAIGSWDVSNVTNMRDMFSNAQAFNQPIGSWDASKVTNMRSMFYEAKAFNQDIRSWDVSQVTDMWDMFKHCPIGNSEKGLG